MDLNNIKDIKLSELCELLKKTTREQITNNKILLYCFDNNPENYIRNNLPAVITTRTFNFNDTIYDSIFSNLNINICIIKNVSDNKDKLNKLFKFINDKSINVGTWVLFSKDNNFYTNEDNLLYEFKIYKLITEEVVTTKNNNVLEDEEEFVNTTGHTESTDDDLVDTNVILFDDKNIVLEDVFQVRIEDDILKAGKIVNVNDIIKEFKTTEEITSSMYSSAENSDDENSINSINIDENNNVINAAVGTLNAVNDFGHYITRGSKCPVCGRYIPFLPSSGYCSLGCAGKDLLRKITSSITGEYKLETPEIIDKIRNIMNYLNLSFNVVSKLPDLLASIATLPDEYKIYATAKLNLIFLDIKKTINLLLIKKNELIVHLLSKIKHGTVEEDSANTFTSIGTILSTSSAMREKLEESLSVAYKAITKASRFFYIGPLEYGFFTTLKSQRCFCPYYKTDKLTYPVEQLGSAYWGSGVMNIAFDMKRCQFSQDIGAKSALKNVDLKKITAAIRKVFKPITTPEYLMDPDLFDVRLALSDLNQGAILKLVNTLQYTMVLGGDFIPDYERLNLTNIWFVIAILMCWGPWTKAIYGDFIYHSFR